MDLTSGGSAGVKWCAEIARTWLRKSLPYAQGRACGCIEPEKSINANKEVVTFNDLCDKYLIETESDRATTRTSRAPLIRRLREQFGKMRLDAMLTDVNKIESWIVSLKREGGTEDLAQSSKGQHCVMLHRLIECAMRWNAIAVQANPIALIHVKGSSKRKKEIVTLTLNSMWR